MKAKIAGAAVVALIHAGCLVGLGSAQAATLTGDKFNISFYYPTRTTLYANEGTFTDPTYGVPVPLDPKGRGSIGPYSIRYVFGQTVHFTKSAFDGVVFTDLTSSRIRFTTLATSGTVTGLDASDLSFTSNSISLNLSDVTAQAGSAIQIAIATANAPTRSAFLNSDVLSPVPLLGAAPMFGVALLALGGISYARRRNQTDA